MFNLQNYEISADNFLSEFYNQMGIKLKRMIEINSKKVSTNELSELYESKNKILDALDCMIHITPNKDMQTLFHTLAINVLSPNEKYWRQTLDFCNRMK